MTNSKLMTSTQRPAERGNTVIISLVVLVVVAVGAIAYFSGKIGAGKDDAPAQVASSGQPAGGAQTADAEGTGTPPNITPGNPVVAKVGGKDVTRLDVFNFIQTLGPQAQQTPIDQLFPFALNQVVNAEIIAKKVSKVKLDDDPAVKAQLKTAKEQIIRGVFIQNEVANAMTDERLKVAYEGYIKNFPEIPEIKTRHILVKEEATAKDVIKQLNAGGDFAAIAKELSVDATKDKGGELGYISRQDQVIPEYLDAAFNLKKGEISKKPVKSDFGYHVIEVLEERVRPAAPFEQAKPFLASQIRNEVLAELFAGWRKDANLEVLDINGNPIEPAAGEEAPAAAPAE